MTAKIEENINWAFDRIETLRVEKNELVKILEEVELQESAGMIRLQPETTARMITALVKARS